MLHSRFVQHHLPACSGVYLPPLRQSLLSEMSVVLQIDGAWRSKVAACAPHAHTKQAAEPMGTLAALVYARQLAQCGISSRISTGTCTGSASVLRSVRKPPLGRWLLVEQSWICKSCAVLL